MQWTRVLDQVIIKHMQTMTSVEYADLFAQLKAHDACPSSLTAPQQVASHVATLRRAGMLPPLPEKPSAAPDLPFLPAGAGDSLVATYCRLHTKAFFGSAKEAVLLPTVGEEWAKRVHGEVVTAMDSFPDDKDLQAFWRRLTAALEK
jgi:hypothetical protein